MGLYPRCPDCKKILFLMWDGKCQTCKYQHPEMKKHDPVRKKELATVHEYKRTCNKCGKVWHTLVEKEEALVKNRKYNKWSIWRNAIFGGSAPEDKVVMGQDIDRGIKYQDKMYKLIECPNCKSTDCKTVIESYVRK